LFSLDQTLPSLKLSRDDVSHQNPTANGVPRSNSPSIDLENRFLRQLVSDHCCLAGKVSDFGGKSRPVFSMKCPTFRVCCAAEIHNQSSWNRENRVMSGPLDRLRKVETASFQSQVGSRSSEQRRILDGCREAMAEQVPHPLRRSAWRSGSGVRDCVSLGITVGQNGKRVIEGDERGSREFPATAWRRTNPVIFRLRAPGHQEFRLYRGAPLKMTQGKSEAGGTNSIQCRPAEQALAAFNTISILLRHEPSAFQAGLIVIRTLLRSLG
jgi:hypothetical protein